MFAARDKWRQSGAIVPASLNRLATIQSHIRESPNPCLSCLTQ
ncbi:Hypothetical protein RAK1035_0830 [Roseovarius sp. AK1035]|nr:Hypothetical protein RAK1035_0830 [Roseovarius sp. AK1035]